MKTCPYTQGVRQLCDKENCEWWDDNQCVVHHIKDWLKDIAKSVKRKGFTG